jgi:hypothetical protein
MSGRRVVLFIIAGGLIFVMGLAVAMWLLGNKSCIRHSRLCHGATWREAALMDDDVTIEEYLDELRGRIQLKLARGGAPADAETLRMVCLAIALRVADPAGIRLLTEPLSPRLYASIETVLAHVDHDFVDEITELQDLIADAQEDPAWLVEIQQAVDRGAVSGKERPQEHIAQLILELFVEL